MQYRNLHGFTLSIITSHHNHTQYIHLINILVHHYALSEGKSTAIISLVERQFPQRENPGCPPLPNMGKRGTFHLLIRTTNGLSRKWYTMSLFFYLSLRHVFREPTVFSWVFFFVFSSVNFPGYALVFFFSFFFYFKMFSSRALCRKRLHQQMAVISIDEK